MSRTEPRQSEEKPWKRNYRWSGNDGVWSYWNHEKEERVFVGAKEFAFLVLDRRNAVTGFSESDNCGIYSNEVLHGGEPYKVETYNGTTLAEGKWKEIKDTVKAAGGKFSIIVYAIAKIEGNYEICRITLAGSGLGDWFEFSKETNVEGDVAICVSDTEAGQKGAVKYLSPKFGTKPVSPEAVKVAEEKDRELQEFFRGEGDSQPSRDTSPETTPEPEVENEIPF